MIDLPPVIAHRGASAYAPENTLAAFQQAKACGADWVEFDVMLSADEEAFIFHDETLDRTTNKKGPVAPLTIAEILELDAGSWFADEHQGARVPTLKDGLDHLKQNQLGANIEIKPLPGQAKRTAELVLERLSPYRDLLLNACLLSSFELEAMETLRENNCDFALGFLQRRWRDDAIETARRLNCYSIHLNRRFVTHKRVQLIKSAGFKVLAYTVNTPTMAKKFWRWGVDAVFTDHPDIILKAYEENSR